MEPLLKRKIKSLKDEEGKERKREKGAEQGFGLGHYHVRMRASIRAEA
jgi:hypothetical protein